jgi:competence protein ComEC
LFTGDITSKIFEGVLDDVGDFNVDILKTPHHGGKNTINDRILSVVNPKEVVISVGDNSYGHPSLETLDLLEKFKIKVLRTDILGNIVFQ